MGKGLPRSLSRANPRKADIVKLTIPLRDFEVAVTGGASTAAGFGTAPIAGLPEGNILLLGAVFNGVFSSASAEVAAAFDGDFSVGTVPTADNDVADSGEADVIASTALGAATAKVSPAKRATNSTQAIIDNTDGSLELNLNLLTDDDSVTDGETATFLVNGLLSIALIVLGDD